MTTSELLSYIRKQIQNNIPKDLIIDKLLEAGWHKDDIDEAFLSIESEVNLVENKKEETSNKNAEENKNISDQYREPLVGDNIFTINKLPQKKVISVVIEPKKEEQIVEIPKIIEPAIEPTPKIEIKEPEPVKPIEENLVIDVKPIEEPIKSQAPKVWIPMAFKTKESSSFKVEKSTDLIIQTPELEARNIENKSKIEEIKESPKKEELIPTLIPKTESVAPVNNVIPVAPVVGTLPKNLPKIAMLSSYQNDLIIANKKKLETKNINIKKNSSKIIKIGVIIMVLAIVGGLIVWATVSGYINFDNINISFIKKDPKVLLLNNSKKLLSLNSYKTETNIEVLSPSFLNITYGLITGEAVTTNEKDSISLFSLGMVNKTEGKIISDNLTVIKSSMLPDNIKTEIKNNDSELYVSVPDLNSTIGENAPKPATVKISKQEFDSIYSLFSSETKEQLQKIDFYKVISSGIPSFINNDIINAYNDLINEIEITEKGQENIKGIETYHYSVVVDRQLAKNLLTKISDNLFINLSNEDKDRLTEILGSLTINSFEVWVGKGDSTIYQYSVNVDIPLSKVVGFDDKSIGDNKVNITWKTTYFDFDVANEIILPETSITANDFVKSVKELKLKNEVSSFKKLTDGLYSIEKSYGSKPNVNGSCMTPVAGSLFSPTGHPKNAAQQLSSVSLFLNNIMGITGGLGSCRSTTKAWSFAIPISDSYDPTLITEGGYQSFFCVDSTGTSKELIAMPTGVVCE